LHGIKQIRRAAKFENNKIVLPLINNTDNFDDGLMIERLMNATVVLKRGREGMVSDNIFTLVIANNCMELFMCKISSEWLHYEGAPAIHNALREPNATDISEISYANWKIFINSC
jgi:hypothetical protein